MLRGSARVTPRVYAVQCSYTEDSITMQAFEVLSMAICPIPLEVKHEILAWKAT